ncbi:hypothetical protein PR048_011979 [Dryococelus australis]|uniref:Uncharacterized protein n=1 Tax=Dryococelus australis TaxID=614101 RepID=A0ABQ9HN20_9NEOP|nr:hypothetical protein PR048_011979 [Dryococelus australis]
MCPWSHGGVVVRLLGPHLGEPDSIPGGVTPGFSQVGIMPDNAAGRWVFSGTSRFPLLFISAPLHTHLTSPSAGIKGGSGRSPRKPTDQRHRPARFPHAKVPRGWDPIYGRPPMAQSGWCAAALGCGRHWVRIPTHLCYGGRGGCAVSLSTSHRGKLSLIPDRVTPGFSQVRIVPRDAAGWRVFSGISRFPYPCILVLLHSHLISHSSTLKTSLLKVSQTSQLNSIQFEKRFLSHIHLERTGYIVERKSFGGGGIMVWAGIMFRGRLELHISSGGTVTRQSYDVKHFCVFTQNFTEMYSEYTEMQFELSPLASHQCEPDSIPGRVTGFSHVGVVLDDAVGRQVYSGISRFSRPLILALLHTHLNLLIGSQDLDVKRRPNPFTHSFIFVEENARVDRTNLVEEFREVEIIHRTDWPAKSPDMNAI